MSFIMDYVITFDRMITPYLLTVSYWFFALIVLIVALQAPETLPLADIMMSELGIPVPVISIIVFLVGLGLLRILFETMILVFKMYDVMHRIAENGTNRAAPQPEPTRSTRGVDRDEIRLSTGDA